MLYWLLYLKLFHYFPPFRIFRYLTFRTAFASLTALFLCVALGPWIKVGVTEAEARTWKIRLLIERKGENVLVGKSSNSGKTELTYRQEGWGFKWETSVGQIKRTFKELAEFLFRSQVFPHGAALLTGTGIVPPDDFTLQSGDSVRIEITGIGWLENDVKGV